MPLPRSIPVLEYTVDGAQTRILLDGVDLTGAIQDLSVESERGRPYARVRLEFHAIIRNGVSPERLRSAAEELYRMAAELESGGSR